MNTDNYFIHNLYIHRKEEIYFNDIHLKDEWQKEVYEFARDIFLENKFSKIIDVGTGSAYKFLLHFDKFDTLGIDVPETVKWLKNQYPTKKWSDSLIPIQQYDMIIAADIIEHMLYPDILLDFIEKSHPKLIIISTTRRLLINNDGPPKNISHIREWSFKEFNDYIKSRFNILKHFISNTTQHTQVILAKIKHNYSQ